MKDDPNRPKSVMILRRGDPFVFVSTTQREMQERLGRHPNARLVGEFTTHDAELPGMRYRLPTHCLKFTGVQPDPLADMSRAMLVDWVDTWRVADDPMVRALATSVIAAYDRADAGDLRGAADRLETLGRVIDDLRAFDVEREPDVDRKPEGAR